MGDVNNFKFFDDLIHSESENIVLTSDIILDEDEEDQYSRGIEIDLNDLTIDGNGHTIDAMGKARIFECIWRNILIKNIALNNGLAIDGGAIYNKGNLKIMSSKISRNKSLNNGGAIYNLGEMVLIDSYISACLSKEGGGAIYNSRGELEIIDSKIISNTLKIQILQEVAPYIMIMEEYPLKIHFYLDVKRQWGAIFNKGYKLDITDSTLTIIWQNGVVQYIIRLEF